MWLAIGSIVGMLLLGLSLAWYNINDIEGQQRRIEMRRAQRRAKKIRYLNYYKRLLEEKEKEDKE